MDAILRSPCMAKIQAWIIAHKLLFTKAHGAIARVFSGSPDFNSRGFMQKMRLILGPYIQKALHAGKKSDSPAPCKTEFAENKIKHFVQFCSRTNTLTVGQSFHQPS